MRQISGYMLACGLTQEEIETVCMEESCIHRARRSGGGRAPRPRARGGLKRLTDAVAPGLSGSETRVWVPCGAAGVSHFGAE
jgi:hypothetical protein